MKTSSIISLNRTCNILYTTVKIGKQILAGRLENQLIFILNLIYFIKNVTNLQI
jgi:hypothetical protein